MRARLFAWTCAALVLAIAAFSISERVALLLYLHSFPIAPGTSWGKVTTLLAWLLCAYLIALISVRRGWRQFRFRWLLIAFVALVASLMLVNILAFNSMLDAAGGGALSDALGFPKGRLAILTHRPEAYITYSLSTLGHTHSLKPVIYWALNPFVDLDEAHYDVGAGLYDFYPAPWLICPIVVALLIAYIAVCALLIARTASEGKAYLAWFSLLLLGLASFSFFEAALDGGPLGTSAGMGAALLSLYLLLLHVRGKREVKWIPALIFLPLLVRATFNALSLAPWGVSAQEHFLISNLGIAVACLYEFKRSGTRSRVLALIAFLLAFNLSSVRIHSQVWESREGDEVYMILRIDASATDEEILERLADVQELVEPEIIARHARMAFARASMAKAGVTSLDLARRVRKERVTPLGSSLLFRFGDPSLKYSHFVYFPLEEARLSQTKLDPIEVISLRKVGGLVEVGFVAPEGLYGHAAYQFLMLSLSQRGMRPSHCIYALQPLQRNTAARAGEFLRALLPLTRLQPVVGVAFP